MSTAILNEMVCPNCGDALEPYDYDDNEFQADYAWQYASCACKKCKKVYEFACVYKFSHYELEDKNTSDLIE